MSTWLLESFRSSAHPQVAQVIGNISVLTAGRALRELNINLNMTLLRV